MTVPVGERREPEPEPEEVTLSQRELEKIFRQVATHNVPHPKFRSFLRVKTYPVYPMYVFRQISLVQPYCRNQPPPPRTSKTITGVYVPAMSAGGHCGGTGSSKIPQTDLSGAVYNSMLCKLCCFAYRVVVESSCNLPSMMKTAGTVHAFLLRPTRPNVISIVSIMRTTLARFRMRLGWMKNQSGIGLAVVKFQNLPHDVLCYLESDKRRKSPLTLVRKHTQCLFHLARSLKQEDSSCHK